MEKICGDCGKIASQVSYYKIPIGKNNYSWACKSCLKKKYNKYKNFVSDAGALWLVLSEIGVPFVSHIYERCLDDMSKAQTNADPIAVYLRCMNESGEVFGGFWESDVMLDMITETLVDRENSLTNMDIVEQQDIWGKYITENGDIDLEAYLFLDKTMNDYTEDLESLDANTEKRYRDLCRCELRLRRANESGDGAEISKAQDSLNKQLSLLGLNDFKAKDNDERKLFIDKIAWMIEETEPCEEEDKEKYADIAGYEHIYNDWMRSMQNTLCHMKQYPNIPKEEE